MKKFLIFLIIWLGLISLLYLLHSDVISKESNKTEVSEEIDSLYSKFDKVLIEAFYSVEELRPFSIVQIDKVIELYNKNEGWLSPDILASKLDKKDIRHLMDRVVEYINSFSPESRKVKTIDKLSNWCKAYSQFKFLVEIMRVDDTNLKDLIHNVNVKKGFDAKYFDIKSIPNKELTFEQKKYVFYQTLNLLASMQMTQQFRYYVDIYTGISEFNSK